MSQPGTPIPREIKAAAIVAFIGGGLFILPGVLLGGSTIAMLVAILHQHPGTSLRHGGPDFTYVLRTIGFWTALLISIGGAGIVVGRGLLRLREWARDAALAWSLGSTLLLLSFFALPQHIIGVRPSPVGIALMMVFLFPVSAWWLILFSREETKKLFGPAIPAAARIGRPEWLNENFVGKCVVAVGALAIVAFSANWIIHKNAAMREIERSRDALNGIRSWHMHTVRHIPGQPAENVDEDTLCPSFQRHTSSWVDAKCETRVRDSIHYFSDYYNLVDGLWLAATPRAGYNDPAIVECQTGPIGSDQNSLPLSAVIEDGSAERGNLKQVDGETCRDFEIYVPTPHDPQEGEFHFNICISEINHLPRETRRTPPDYDHEGVTVYSQWNAMSEPELPVEIPR